MTWVAAAVVAGSTLVSGYMGANAAKKAGQQYKDAAMAGIDQQREMFDTINKYAAPYRGIGYSSLNTIGSMLPGEQNIYDPVTGKVTGTQEGTGYLTKPFDMADINNYMSPNYRFALEQGTGAAKSGLNAAGGLVGGNAMKGIEDYTQNLATGSINDAMKNYYIGQQAVSSNLSNIANIGLGGQGLTSTAGMNSANNISSLLSSMGNAQASATMGASNAFTSGLNNLGSYAMLYGMKNFMNPGTTSGSDIRLKENIKQIGKLNNGLNVYTFEYKQEFKDHPYCGHGKYIGVMAHEVEDLMPEAVFELDNGYKAVNYGMIQ